VKIVADENNPFVGDAFSALGEVVVLPGKNITRKVLKGAEVLACRSTIQVNADLLEGTAVKYIGTGTIGTDHFDTDYLDSKGILYCNAPGCNADSVADYMTAALLHVAARQKVALVGKTLGVIGCGNVGSRVVKRARALGMRVLENDPPLARKTGDPRYRPLDELFEADYLTLHTPLTKEGADATWHLAGAKLFDKMQPHAVLINASRGAVVDGAALKDILKNHSIAGAVLDVWEGEPAPDPELASLTYLATPHIAGHSFDGKANGTNQIYRQICEWTGVEPTWDPSPCLPEPDVPEIEIDARSRADEDVLREAVFRVYPILEDDGRFRQAMANPDPDARAETFRALRKNYPRRREFKWTTVRLRNGSDALAEALRGLTFGVEMG